MKQIIRSVEATEILDSGNNPTLQLEIELDMGTRASGEMDDAFIADFAVAMGGDQLKAGSR